MSKSTPTASTRRTARSRGQKSSRYEYEHCQRGVDADARAVLETVALLAFLPFSLPLAASAFEGTDAPAKAERALKRLCACGLLATSESVAGEPRWRFVSQLFHAFAQRDDRGESAALNRLLPVIRVAAESELARNEPAEFSTLIDHIAALLQHRPAEAQWPALAQWLHDAAPRQCASLGRREHALRCLAIVNEWFGNLPPAALASAEWMRERCMLHAHRADLLTEDGALPAALLAAEEASALAGQLAAANPDAASLRRQQMLLEKLADLHTVSGDHAAAETLYTAMQAVAERLAASEAPLAEPPEEKLSTLFARGDAEYERQHFPAAASAYAAARQLAERRAVELSTSPEALAEWYLALAKLGRAQAAAENHAAACDAFAEACLVATEAHAKSPADAVWTSRLRAMLSRLGGEHIALGETSAAISVYGRELELAEKIAATMGGVAAQRDLSACLLNLGRALVPTRAFSAAKHHTDRAIALRAALFAESPANPERKRELLVAHARAGSVLVSANALGDATAEFETSLKLAEELCAADPNNTAHQADLAVLREQLALLRAITPAS